MKPLVDLPDPERVVVDALVAAGFSTASTNYPSNTLTGSNTRLQVDLETSNTGGFPIVERAQVRVTAHTAPGKRDEVKELAGDALAALYRFAGNANAAGIVPLGGRSGVVTDPSTRNLMCWVLVRVDLKASPAS